MGSTGDVSLTASVFDEDVFEYHVSLLRPGNPRPGNGEHCLAPIVASCVFAHASGLDQTVQFGLLAGDRSKLRSADSLVTDDPRIFFNVTPPSSTFICGSQGSGKSHTLACILENCLIPCRVGRLSSPLTALVFHYDTFISDNMGSPCEAAFLATHSQLDVRVLCSPTNLRTIKGTYSRFNITVAPLELDQEHLNTQRMLDLMAVGQDESPMPLYMHTVKRILRDMRITQQEHETGFDYQGFKQRLMSSNLSQAQLEPLSQRLDTLESFMPKSQTGKARATKGKKSGGSIWEPQARQLTIIDLSCPCISPETACSLFNICASIFLEQKPSIGRVMALDEAHKYMNKSVEARGFTETLLSAVRLQRHLGVRMIISTQEPTISTALLNLCSTTIVHRFSSPEWLHVLQKHLAGATVNHLAAQHGSSNDDEELRSLFGQVVELEVGEALIFSPSAIVRATCLGDGRVAFTRLGSGRLYVKIRQRVTCDGGKSLISL
ncbi:uncharacterized protein BJX67DRAFT_375647 [Aspergillus lucknowensis]|uniref:P-loop containing nucleoside triphosphate hydrolase protein n=1 Tax=Aspergillus lucknowensis TaxID=176173 RepID=A0ABR4LA51_9EURO